MISARNYAAQAEAGINRWASAKASYKYRDLDVAICGSIAKSIKDAVHFAIPDGGVIFDDDLKGILNTTIRLPYPVITVEYYCNFIANDLSELTPTYAPKRLILASEVNRSNCIKQAAIRGIDIHNFMDQFPDDEFIHIIVLNEIDGVWLPCPMSFYMPTTWNYSPDGKIHLHVHPLVSPESSVYFSSAPVPVLPGLFTWMCEMGGEKKVYQEAIHDISGEARALLEFCEALTCSNVITNTIQVEGKKANPKRVKHGKLPIYETKVLSLVVPKSKSPNRAGLAQDSRASPRHHLRRGHIRTLQDGRRIWINSCSVGYSARGVIDKSYKVSAANQGH